MAVRACGIWAPWWLNGEYSSDYRVFGTSIAAVLTAVDVSTQTRVCNVRGAVLYLRVLSGTTHSITICCMCL